MHSVTCVGRQGDADGGADNHCRLAALHNLHRSLKHYIYSKSAIIKTFKHSSNKTIYLHVSSVVKLIIKISRIHLDPDRTHPLDVESFIHLRSIQVDYVALQ